MEKQLIAPPCPLCQQPGRLRSVEFRAWQRTLSYVCGQCAHEWVLIRAARPDVLFGEPA